MDVFLLVIVLYRLQLYIICETLYNCDAILLFYFVRLNSLINCEIL